MSQKETANGRDLFFSQSYEFFTKYLPKQKNGSMHTIRSYKGGLKALADYVTDVIKKDIDSFCYGDATYDFILDYRNYLHDTLNLSERTTNNRLSFVKSYISYCAGRDVSIHPIAFAIRQVPFYRVPVLRQSIIEDDDALAALLDSPLNTDKGIRDRNILCILYDAALRVDELISLTVGDVIWGKNIKLVIHGKGNKEREILIDDKTSALVNQYRTVFHQELDPGRPFFYTVISGEKKQMTTRNVNKLVSKYANQIRKDYEIPDTVSPHTLRRTRGTMLYRDGVPLEAISRFLGHSSVEVTRKHYAFPSERQLIETATKKTAMIPEVAPFIDRTDNDTSSSGVLWPSTKEELYKVLGL